VRSPWEMPLAYIGIFDYLTFRARQHGRDRVHVSYATMARNLHTSRRKLVQAIRDFEAFGLLRKIKHRVLVAWQGVFATRQGTNEYVFSRLLMPASEFRSSTTIREKLKKEAQRENLPTTASTINVVQNGLDAALAKLSQAISSREPQTG